MNAVVPASILQFVRAGRASPFIHAGRMVLSDLLSTLLFVGLFALTGSVLVATGLAVAAGIGHVLYLRVRGRPVEVMEWVSLGLVAVLGGASLLTRDPRFVMLKPTFIYVGVGCAMTKRGWMLRYLPPQAGGLVDDVTTGFGYAWSGLMFLTAALNVALVAQADARVWALFLAVFPPASKGVLFLGQYLTTRAAVIARRAAGSSPRVNAAQP
jgi:intracellular septation protein A